MPPDIGQIILDELREFRATDQTWKQDTGERIQNMETSVAMVLNGDLEGSLPQLQKRVAAMEKKFNLLAGVWATLTAIGTVGGVVIGLAMRFLHGK
jgi:hypothetical protein